MAKKTLTVTKATVPEAKKDLLIKLGQLAENNYQMQLWVKDIVDDLPEEQLLESAAFVPEFAWSNTTYPGSTDPSKEGKPVLVLAFKTYEGLDANAPSISYNFIDMSSLADIYEADNSGNKAVDITVDDYKVSAALKLYEANIGAPDNEATNLAEIKDGKLYVPTPAAFDASGLTNRISSLETTVGHEAITGEEPQAATGLVKDVADLQDNVSTIFDEIGEKAQAESSEGAGDAVAASGIYKYVDDAIAGVQDGLNYATDTDIQGLFD